MGLNSRGRVWEGDLSANKSQAMPYLWVFFNDRGYRRGGVALLCWRRVRRGLVEMRLWGLLIEGLLHLLYGLFLLMEGLLLIPMALARHRDVNHHFLNEHGSDLGLVVGF